MFFYSFVITALLTGIGVYDDWGKKAVLKSLFPVTMNYYWYFTAFFALFLAIPVLNKFLFSIDVNTAKKAFIITILLFSVMETVSFAFETNQGYSAIWLMVLYCIGVLAKRMKLFEKTSSIRLVMLWALCILLSWGLFVLTGINRLINYVSPTMLVSGIIMVVLFSRIKIKGSIIKKIAPFAFGVYLIQLNRVVWYDVLDNTFSWVVEQPIYIGVILVIVFAFAIFAVGLLLEYIRSELAKLVRIPALSKRIAARIEAILNRLCTFLD